MHDSGHHQHWIGLREFDLLRILPSIYVSLVDQPQPPFPISSLSALIKKKNNNCPISSLHAQSQHVLLVYIILLPSLMNASPYPDDQNRPIRMLHYCLSFISFPNCFH